MGNMEVERNVTISEIPDAMQLKSALCGSTATGETSRRAKAEKTVDLMAGGR